MADWNNAVALAGAAILTSSGLPGGEIIGCVNALFSRNGPPTLKALAKVVERGLADAIAAEHRGTPLEPVQADLENLLTYHAPTLRTIVDTHGMNPDAIAAAILDHGSQRFDHAHRPILGMLLTGIYSRYLADRQLLDDLVPEALRSLLAMREEIEKLPERTAEALLDLQTRLLLQDGRRFIDGLPGQPSWLLRPDYAVVPFHPARAADLADLEAWCAAENRRTVRLLHGAGGLGKTRLAMELIRRLQGQGWQAGFLNRRVTDAPPDTFRRLCNGERPTCIVVDYAETRQEVLVRLLRRVRTGMAPKLRILLLARAAAEWWQQLGRADADVQELMGAYADATALRPIAETVEHRALIFTRASQAFAKKLDLAAPESPLPNLSADLYGTTLFIHLAALAAVKGETAEATADLLTWVLNRERREWCSGLADVGLDPAQYEPLFTQIVLFATLCDGFADAAEREAVLPRLPLAQGQTAVQLKALACLVDRLYPDGRGSGALRPDLLGEQLIAESLDRDATILNLVFDPSTPRRSNAAATLLTRLAVRNDAHVSLLDSVINSHGEVSAKAFIQAGRTLSPLPINRLKIHLNSLCNLQHRRRFARALLPIPKKSLASKEIALLALGILCEDTTEEASNSDKSLQQADYLCEYSIWLREDTQYQKSLDVITDALNIIEQLKTIDNSAIRMRRIRYLYHQANSFHSLGQHEAALHSSKKSLALFQTTTDFPSSDRKEELARILMNISSDLQSNRQYVDALSAISESAKLFEELIHSGQSNDFGNFAGTLNNWSSLLHLLSFNQESLRIAELSVSVFRTLTDIDADIFEQYLASSLVGLAHKYESFYQFDDALNAITEATNRSAKLYNQEPKRFMGLIASSLNNHSIIFSRIGKYSDALLPGIDAVGFRRVLSDENPSAYLPELALSLNNLGCRFLEIGCFEIGYMYFIESLFIYRKLIMEQSNAYEIEICRPLISRASLLFMWGIKGSSQGLLQDALDASEAAVRHCRKLSTIGNHFVLDMYAVSLAIRADCLYKLDQKGDGVRSIAEAIEVLRPIFLRHPETVSHRMAPIFVRYLVRCQELGVEPDHALLAPIEEAFQRLEAEHGKT